MRPFVIVTAAGLGNLSARDRGRLGLGVAEQFGGFVLGAEFQQAIIVACCWACWRSGNGNICACGRPCNEPRLPPSAALLAHPRGRRLAAPFVFPDYSNEIAVLWLMIVFASTWDILGARWATIPSATSSSSEPGCTSAPSSRSGFTTTWGCTVLGRPHHPYLFFPPRSISPGFALGTVVAGIVLGGARPRPPAGSCSNCAAPISRSARSALPSRRPS